MDFVYDRKRKLKLLIVSANFVIFELLMCDHQFLFCEYFLENVEKSLQSCFRAVNTSNFYFSPKTQSP